MDMWSGQLRFNIEMLANRLAGVTDWIIHNENTKNLRVGYFGASTGAAAALPAVVRAVGSRGGRPDLSGPALAHVQTPRLLIVGEADVPVITL
jgi:hypothetical protein